MLSFAGPVTSYPVGANPHAVAVGDFNNDSCPDMASADFGANTVTVYLNNCNGSGLFTFAGTYPTGPLPIDIKAADINGDGNLDLVTANFSGGSVSVLLGNGNGTFQPPVTYTTFPGLEPDSVAVGDLNGDGFPDIVTANYATNDVSVLLSPGYTATTYATGGIQPISVVLAPFNNLATQYLDIAVAHRASGDVAVLLGNGNGTFLPPVLYPFGIQGSSIAAGDFDLANGPDIVVTDAATNNVAVFLNNGNGTFPPAQITPVCGGGSPMGVAVADYNQDTFLDLAVTTSINTLAVFLGNGNGTFACAPNYPTYPLPAGTNPIGIDTGDFDQNTDLEVVVAGSGNNTLNVFLNDGLPFRPDSLPVLTATTSDVEPPLRADRLAMPGAVQAVFAEPDNASWLIPRAGKSQSPRRDEVASDSGYVLRRLIRCGSLLAQPPWAQLHKQSEEEALAAVG